MDYDEAYSSYRLDYNTGYEGDFSDWLEHVGLDCCTVCDRYLERVEHVSAGALAGHTVCLQCLAEQQTTIATP